MEQRKPSGVTLSVLDLGSYSEGMRWGGIVHNGEVYAICSEGVGYNLTSKSSEELAQHWGQSLQEIRAQIDTAAHGQVALEDLIRQFGDRLEVNYSIWCDRLGQRA